MLEPWTWVLLLALGGFSLLAYALRVLDAGGSFVSFLLGLVIVLAGDLAWLLMMAVFTGIAFLATRAGGPRKVALGLAEEADGERSASNVIGNGMAPALAALTFLFMDPLAAKLAFVAAVAAITADTLGSEIGSLSPRARLITPPFPRRTPGTNGAVSWLGQGVSLAGAVAIGVAGALLLGVPWEWVPVPVLAGFVGGQLDSVLGATLERDRFHRQRPLSKQDVNFLASFLPALAVLLAVQLAHV